ncbi:integrase_H2C2 domain-containing protein [Trichonephila clavata]|uniref:Integrase_H2C2 domain-containing protein n=1 Tax=Trichonephila clavata TaxID=2740835 RepID=A0A8X6H762_TRICU|nr:integrase_H2C2 domain-containing protein [Trichonephila clavata]
MSKEILVVLNRKRGAVKAQLTRIKDFINNPNEKDKTKLESKMDTLKSLRIKLSDIRNEYLVDNDSDLEPLELYIYIESLDLEDVIAKISRIWKKIPRTSVTTKRFCNGTSQVVSSSNPLLLPDSMCQDKDLSYSSSTETLGLLWKPHPDSFAFKISPMASDCDSLIVTKKSVISTIARIFDPLGLIGPVITRAKMFLQSLWKWKLGWNYPLPSNLVSYWKSFIDALESINCLNILRYCLQDKSIRTELHGFSDSSEKA